MASLGFDLLDRHVVAGGADEPAAPGLTFARLLERSAALAGGLRILGVERGQDVVVAVGADDRVVAVCAVVRLGAVPVPRGPSSAVAVVDGADGPVVRVGADEHPLDLVRQAGSGDAAMALAGDADGYRETVRQHAADVVEPLLDRRPVG